MSKFLCDNAKSIKSYVPGEQPQGRSFIKLNTNESPFALPVSVQCEIAREAERLQLYPDPQTTILNDALASQFNLQPNNFVTTNGSDEALAFIALAFCRGKKVMFPDVTYGFYSSICHLYNIDYVQPKLSEDFTINFNDYKDADVIFLANPNAQTGIAVKANKICELLKENENRLIVVDEAYVDFGGQSVISLVNEYDNLIVVRTMSKSLSLAGGRIGYSVSNVELANDIMSVKNSFNPYSVNRMSIVAGTYALKSQKYFDECNANIVSLRNEVTSKLIELGFDVLPSSANFVLAKNSSISGGTLKKALQDMGILVRHFEDVRLQDYVRITIGSGDEMNTLIECTQKILENTL